MKEKQFHALNFILIDIRCISTFLRCRVIVHFFKDAHRVSVSEVDCDCGSMLMDVEFQKVNSDVFLELHTGSFMKDVCAFLPVFKPPPSPVQSGPLFA